jgi:hypothetical protein
MNQATYQFERGPWPQPAPQAPDRAAPAVLHLPPEERSAWQRHVGYRYLFQSIVHLPGAVFWALRNRGLKPVSDARFGAILTDGIIGKFLCAELNDDDREVFREYLDDPGAKGSEDRWYKSDFTPMKFIASEPDGDSATAPAVVLWRRAPGGAYSVVAVSVGRQAFDPRSPGESWALAKYFALQGAGVCTTLLMHPLLHFPTDAVNAITRTLLPQEHPLFQLLSPHWFLQLGVDDAVLHNGGTVLKSGPYRFYAPYPGSFAEHARLVSSLWTGSTTLSGRPNSAFPSYRFPLDGWTYHCDYSLFLREYFETLLRFTTPVAAHVLAGPEAQVALVRQWARHIAWWVPGFPDEEKVVQGDNLARALASVIHDVAVGHSADHYLYSQVDQQEVPFILHTPTPTGAGDAVDRRSLVGVRDAVRYRMCMRLFFNPAVVARLQDTRYPFTDEKLKNMARTFHEDLQQTPARIKSKGLREYIPLGEMASSIQY